METSHDLRTWLESLEGAVAPEKLHEGSVKFAMLVIATKRAIAAAAREDGR